MAAAKKNPAKKPAKVDPKILGTGAARKAGDAIKNRKKQLEDAMKGAKASPKKKKKTQYA